LKVIVTGSNGTVGKVLKAYLEICGLEVFGWDRKKIPVNNSELIIDYVKQIAPEIIFHLATNSNPVGIDNEGWIVNVEWSSLLANAALEINARFVFTSTVMVYSIKAII
jgi:dTDP-4-dehydrorhamnose reductase